MRKSIIVIVLMIFLSIFCHFYNKHVIFQTARENIELEDILNSKKDLNRNLRMENIDLNSLARIETIAMSELNMIYPENDKDRHTILFDESKQMFSLLDFFIPTVEALVNN